MRELLAGLVPGLPATAVRAILDRADGIPLYAVETVRMLVAEGRLAIEDGVYRPVGDLTTLAVPETLTALIASRLDGLAADDRALISDAAVLGQSFSLAGLSAVSGIAEAELEPRLRTLVRQGAPHARIGPAQSRSAASTSSSRRSSARSPTTPWRSGIARSAIWPRRDSSRASTRTRSPAVWPVTTWRHTRTRPRARRPTPSPGRPASRFAAPLSERSRSARTTRRSTFLRQALSVTTDPAETAELLERAGDDRLAGRPP